MRSGYRRSFLRIESPVKTKNPDSGATSITGWLLFATMWASIETLSTYEKKAADASWPGADSRIGIKYKEGFLPTMRIVHGTVIYSILGIDDLEQRHRDIVFTCQRGLKSL